MTELLHCAYDDLKINYFLGKILFDFCLKTKGF